jgi:hypothetical protein
MHPSRRFISFTCPSFSLSARRAQSTLAAKATRQENSIRSFKILMAIGPPLRSVFPAGSARQYLGQTVMEDWLNWDGGRPTNSNPTSRRIARGRSTRYRQLADTFRD